MTTKQIDNAKVRLLAELPTQAKIAALDIAALVKNRVVQTGINAEGQAFSPYSEKQAPAYLYFGRSRSQQGESRVRGKAKRREGVSYREFREMNNLNTGIKNFEFTGEMWRGVEVTESKSGVVSSVVIAGNSQEVRDKLRYATEAEKINILRPNKEEIEVVQAALTRWLTDLLKSELA